MKKALLLFALAAAICTTSFSQTTITTAAAGNVGYTGSNYIGGNTTVTFVIQNASSNDIVLTKLEDFKSGGTPSFPTSPGSFTLWYSPTSLSGTPGLVSVANGWTKITGDNPVSVNLIVGYNTIFPNINFTIPANTTYRFALESFSGLAYSGGLTPGLCSPSTLTKDSVSLILGDAKIGGQPVGYAGSFPNSSYENSWFTGSITFNVAVPCTAPPIAGTTVSATSDTCAGHAFKLDLSGQSNGSGQTYQWQSSTTNSNFTDIAGANGSSLTTSQLVSKYYRCAVTCGGLTSYSTPLQITTPASISGTYTINQNNPTGGNNFSKFSDAVDYIKCSGINGPVVFNVVSGSGPYNEQVKIPFIGGVSGTNTITFNGHGEVLSFAAGTVANKAILTFNNASHIIIDSLTIDGTQGSYNWNVLFMNQSDSNIIRNCTLLNNATSTALASYNCILFNGSTQATATSGNNGSYNLIENNTISGGGYGIYMFGSGIATENVGNKIINNNITDFYNSAIYASATINDLVISKNNISRSGRVNTASTASGIATASNCLNTLIEKNKIHNMFDMMPANTSACYPINISSSSVIGKETKVFNNLIYNMNGSGVQSAIYNASGNNMKAYNNTISLDDANTATNAANGFTQTGTATGVDFSNNVIAITRNTSGKIRCLNYSNTANIVSNHNAFYISCPASSDTAIGQWGTTSYITLSNWRSANNNAYDQQSVNTNPLFVNTSANDFTPTAPALNDIAQNVGIATDIVGNNRSSISPDPGAFEFNIANCTNPVNAGAAMAVVNSTCPSVAFNLELSDNTFGEGQTYQWQVSPNNATFTNIGSAGTNIFYQNTQPSTNYYRCAVQCNGGTVAYSTSVLVTTPSYVSGTFTINNSLPTAGTNFNSFNDALNAIKCGINGPVVFNVVAGANPFQERFTIPEISGASAINTLTINGNGATLQYSTSDANSRAAIILNGADHIIIDSLNIDVSGGSFGWGILITNQADSNIIRNCNITASVVSSNQGSAGILFNGSTVSLSTSGNNGNYNSIINNTITGGYYSVWLYGSSSSTTQNINNSILKNKFFDMYAYGVYAVYQSAGLLISENDISRPNRTTSTSAGGVYIYTGCADAVVEKNKVHNLFNAMLTNTSSIDGIFIGANPAAGHDNKVINNLIYNVNGSGVNHGITCTFGNNAKVYHNTIVLDDQASATTLTYGFYQPVQATGIDFRNNIVYVSRNSSATKSCLFYGSSLSTINSNNNILYSTNGNVATLQGTSYANLSSWQAANSNAYDQQSVSADPVFASVTNYLPTATAVDNAGTALGITTDIAGTTRSSANPDAGCYEFAGALPITGLDFKGEKTGEINKLSWTTLTEKNNYGFEILSSKTNSNNGFSKIGFVSSKAADGNSNTLLSYTFNDVNSSATNTYYKLKQIDKGGKFVYSNIVFIKAVKSINTGIVSVFPNPVSDNLNVVIEASIANKATLLVVDIFGKTMLQKNINLSEGENVTSVHLNSLAAGKYLLKLVCNNGCQTSIQKFVKK